MSPYLNRELDHAEHATLETHVFACERCQRELERFRMLLGALRALPSASPPPDLVSRVMARYRAERLHDAALAAEEDPREVSVGPSVVAAPLQPDLPGRFGDVPALPPVPAAARPTAGWQAAPVASGGMLSGRSPDPAQRGAPSQGLIRSFALVAALLFAVFTGTLLSDRAVPSRLGNLQARQVVDAMLPVSFTPPSGTRGRLGQWNEASLGMVGTAAPEQRLPRTELAWQLPPGVQLNMPRCLGGTCLQSVADLTQAEPVSQLVPTEQEATHFVLMPCNIPSQGRYEQRVLWRAMRSGRYRAYVELRCDGLYRRAAFDLEVQP